MLDLLDFSGQRILVTGASSGLGRDLCMLLSELGAQLILVARDAVKLEETRSLLKGEGHIVRPYDLRDYAKIEKWMKETVLPHAPLTGCVHAAGEVIALPVRATSIEKFDRLMALNVSSGFALAKAFRNQGMFKSPASIVFYSSVTGLVGKTGMSAYCTSKGALVNLTRALAVEMARDGIRVNCVAPGHVMSGMAAALNIADGSLDLVRADHPLGLGQARDVSHAVAFLLAPTARWITGTTLVVDGGYTAH